MILYLKFTSHLMRYMILDFERITTKRPTRNRNRIEKIL